MRKPVIGVMGAGEGARPEDIELAEMLGERIARQGWILLTGGRPSGVMEAAMRGAKRVSDSVTIGVLPGTSGASSHVDIAIFTDMGNARNAINVLSSDVVIACGKCGAGTASEVALAVKSGKPVVLLAPTPEAEAFFRSIARNLSIATTAEEAVEIVSSYLVGRK